jgi:peptidoglycan hydrolase CwlO-like protein
VINTGYHHPAVSPIRGVSTSSSPIALLLLSPVLTTMALSKKDLEEIVKSLRGEFSTITAKLTKMEAQLDSIVAENKELKTLVAERDSEIFSLKVQLNTWNNTIVLGASILWASPSPRTKRKALT